MNLPTQQPPTGQNRRRRGRGRRRRRRRAPLTPHPISTTTLGPRRRRRRGPSRRRRNSGQRRQSPSRRGTAAGGRAEGRTSGRARGRATTSTTGTRRRCRRATAVRARSLARASPSHGLAPSRRLLLLRSSACRTHAWYPRARYARRRSVLGRGARGGVGVGERRREPTRANANANAMVRCAGSVSWATYSAKAADRILSMQTTHGSAATPPEVAPGAPAATEAHI
jgi:hypothetical protein